jgi:AcrR family transcriptional regulator
MSTAHEADPMVAAPAISRKPQQGRSKASLERMLAAAEQLMIERGSEEFTLQEVSQRGNVSIGSIYLRFDSKDNLVRAVISDHLERMKAEEDRMLAAVTKSDSLRNFVAAYVEAYAELLKQHAPLLRLTMQRAENDPLVSEPGKRVALRVEDLSTVAMMAYADEMGGKDKELKANSSYHVIFATLARQLSLGSTGESAHDYDWNQLKRELGRMCLAYLKHVD